MLGKDEWVVYSWLHSNGQHMVGRCPMSLWKSEWAKPDRRDGLEIAQCKMLADGLTEEQADKFYELSKGAKDV